MQNTPITEWRLLFCGVLGPRSFQSREEAEQYRITWGFTPHSEVVKVTIEKQGEQQ